jgi:hypothetical protein
MGRVWGLHLCTLLRLSPEASRPCEPPASRPPWLPPIDNTMNHPRRGLLKIKDTVLATEGGCERLGDGMWALVDECC